MLATQKLPALPARGNQSVPILICGLTLLLTAIMSREMGLRSLLIHRRGEWFYRIIISLLAIGGTALVVLGRLESPFIQIWVPPWQWREITYPLTLFAFILAGSELLPAGYLKRYLQHPIYAGGLLWGVAHLISNGDLASILLFGSLTLAVLLKGTAALYKAAAHTKAQAQISIQWDIAAILLGLSAWGLLALYHGPLFGMALDFPV
jgi:uncharacterized membrane protein